MQAIQSDPEPGKDIQYIKVEVDIESHVPEVVEFGLRLKVYLACAS